MDATPEEPNTAALTYILETSRRFFQRIRLIHLVCSVFMFGTGAAATVLSDGSNGSSQIPYFFSAYIAGPWHLLLIALCQVCMYYLSGDSRRMLSASTAVSVYSVVCSVFVLFNVMGLVFVIVNGFCIHNQQCFYDKNEVANRAMAIFLVLQHIVSILFCILFAKRVHDIDFELGSDLSIKLGHYFNLMRQKIRKRHRSTASSTFHASSISTLGSCSSLHRNNTEQVGSNKKSGGIDKEKIVAAFMAKRAEQQQKNRSKSHPNLQRHVHEAHLTEPDMEGTVYSIYSDSETAPSIEGKRKKKRYARHKQNSVQPAETSVENSPGSMAGHASDTEKGAMGLTGRSEDSGVSVDDDKWSSSSTSTFRQRPDLLPRDRAQTSDIGSDVTETDSVIGRYKTHLEQQQQREDIRQQMLDKHKALLDRQNFLSSPQDSPPPPYTEPPTLPNANIMNILPFRKVETDSNPESREESPDQSNC